MRSVQKRRRLLTVSVLAIAAAGAASATVRSVSPTGADAGDCTAAPCRTIQYTVNQSSAGDTILAASGVYAESVVVEKQISLIGGANVHDNHGNDGGNDDHGGGNSILDASGHDNGIVIQGAAASGSVLRGFTVKNAGREGILALQTSHLTISGNTAVDNDAYGPNSPQCPAADPDDCGEAIHLESVTDSTVSGNLVQHNVGGILLTDEEGPASGNVIIDNRVIKNTKDCGITLASHFFLAPPAGPVAEGVGGVYRNQILNNTSDGNGAAGIGIFAGPPGAAAWDNTVAGNTARNNGLPGVAIHSHSPFQYVGGNLILDNTLSGDGPDDDAGTVFPAGISVWSAVVPIGPTTIVGNTIIHEHYGIFTTNAPSVSGLSTNDISKSVDVPIAQN